MDNGFFGRLFDLNEDGKLDSFERFMDDKTFEDLVFNNDKNKENDENE